MASPLDPQELEALMQAIQEGRVGAESAAGSPQGDGSVVPYDLTSQDRIIRGQMPTLDSINERIASSFGRTLGGRLRLELRVAASPAILMKFAEVTGTVADQTITGVLSLGAGHGLALLVIEGALTRGFLGAALGDRSVASAGADTDAEARNELTSVEKLVLKHTISVFCDGMAAAWEEVLPFKPEVLRFESDPRMAIISTPSDVAILCSFEVTGSLDGKLMLAIPYSAVESAKKLLTSPPRLGGQRDARFSQALAREMEAVEVEVRVEIGRRSLTLADLVELKAGDIITLNTNEGSPLPVFVQGRQKMTASPRVVGGGMAVEILRAITQSGQPGRAARAAGQAFTPGGREAN